MAKTDSSLNQFDTQLKAIVAPLLEQHGFTLISKKRIWHRPSPVNKQFVQLIEFIIGQSASLEAGKFTVVLGIYYPQYDKFCNGRKLLGPVLAACHLDMQQRLGMLIPPPEERWWKYNLDEVQCIELLKETTKSIEELGLPWLMKTDTEANAAIYNTGKMPEPDRIRRENYERQKKLREQS